MRMLHGMRQQMFGVLEGRGFVHSSSSSKSANVALVRSVMALGFYPNLAMLKPKLRSKSGQSRENLSFLTSKGERARFSQASVISKAQGAMEGDPPVCVAYDELVRGKAFLTARQCSFVHPLALLLVAKSVQVSGTTNSSTADGSGGGDEIHLKLGKRLTKNIYLY